MRQTAHCQVTYKLQKTRETPSTGTRQPETRRRLFNFFRIRIFFWIFQRFSLRFMMASDPKFTEDFSPSVKISDVLDVIKDLYFGKGYCSILTGLVEFHFHAFILQNFSEIKNSADCLLKASAKWLMKICIFRCTQIFSSI